MPVVCQADVIWIITAVDVRRDDWSAASTQTVVKCRANATQRHCGTFLLSGLGVPLLLTATKMMSSVSFLAVFVYTFYDIPVCGDFTELATYINLSLHM